MFVVYATGQYIGAPNDDGGRCESVTFQQNSKALQVPHVTQPHAILQAVSRASTNVSILCWLRYIT